MQYICKIKCFVVGITGGKWEKVNYKNLLNKFKGEKKMKFKKGLKIIALVSAMTVICGTFFGCGKDESISSDGRVIITVGNWPMKEGRAKELENAKKARFEEANPEFEIVTKVDV